MQVWLEAIKSASSASSFHRTCDIKLSWRTSRANWQQQEINTQRKHRGWCWKLHGQSQARLAEVGQQLGKHNHSWILPCCDCSGGSWFCTRGKPGWVFLLTVSNLLYEVKVHRFLLFSVCVMAGALTLGVQCSAKGTSGAKKEKAACCSGIILMLWCVFLAAL